MKQITVQVPEGYEVVVRPSPTSNLKDNTTLAQERQEPRVYPEPTLPLAAASKVNHPNRWAIVAARPYDPYEGDGYPDDPYYRRRH